MVIKILFIFTLIVTVILLLLGILYLVVKCVTSQKDENPPSLNQNIDNGNVIDLDLIFYPSRELQKIWQQKSEEKEYINELPAQLTASILKEIKEKYLANKSIQTTATFFSQLSQNLAVHIAQINEEQLKNLDFSTKLTIEQINKSCVSNSTFPSLEQIFNCTFNKFVQNNSQLNDEINNDLNKIALLFKTAIQIIIDEKKQVEETSVVKTNFNKT